MMNQNMQGLIYNGAFGTSGPMMQPVYNPYQNNIIQFGNYNQPVQFQNQYQYYNNPYSMQQPQNNGVVFQPVGGYQQQSPYNAYVRQQQSNYYDPYGNTFSQQRTYGNPYSYSNYNGYTPYMSPVAMQQYQNQQIELFKTKYRLVRNYLGKEVDEEYLDRLCNPNNPANRKTQEQATIDEDFKFIQYVSAVANGRIQTPRPQAYIIADNLNKMFEDFHNEYDDHSLCQFLEEDLWRLQRDEWIRKNVNLNGNRNLSAVYNSNTFNELLRLHNGSTNQYINDLLNNSRYDNNLDDIEVGINLAFEKERRRKAILEGKVPEFISSDETQKRRHEWTQQIMNQIYQKGSGI